MEDGKEVITDEYIYIYIYIYKYIAIIHTHTCIHTHIHIYTYTYIYIYLCTYITSHMDAASATDPTMRKHK
jgi:hypothetical protein